MKLSHDNLQVFVGKVTLHIYWPAVYLKKDHIGLYAKTVLNFRPANDWKWTWAAALQILGFGVGVSFNHVNNPMYEEPRHD